jgi:osmotically-inducible protein OsmY
MSELQLRQLVVDELEFEPSVNAAHIGVAAEKGVVTLSGHVNSYVEKLAALTAVRRVRGVYAIADEIEIHYPSDRKTSDDQIARRAVDMLAWDTVVPVGATQVTVPDGWVTLTGSVNWQYQKKAAEDDVRKLSGVHGVINNITIKPHVKADDIKRKIEDALKRHAEVEAKEIRVTIRNDDQVLLEGKVANWDERYAVQNAAWSAPGVKAVEDRLSVGR